MKLGPSDEKRLRALLSLGHELERAWPAPERLNPLLEAVRALADAEAPELRRLAGHDIHLTPGMSARHLQTILVPFERLLGRALRDDEFLVSELDHPVSAERASAPLVVIADNLRSAFNVGAIFRTAEAFGAESVICSGYTPTPDEEKTSRTSMGAQTHIRWTRSPRAEDAIADLRAHGYQIVALETAETAIDLDRFQWPERAALLLGNERFGVDHQALGTVDHIVRIPLFGRKNSLNVGIACGIALSAWREQMRRPKTFEPIGTFHASSKHPYEARRQATEDASGEIGVIRLERGRQFEQALEDLAGFERLWVIYRFHHNENWKPKTLPPRGPRIKRGVFATRSPYRPNPIGLSCVELVEIRGLEIFVRGFDLLDQTPIYDLKPYLPYADAFPNARAGWTDELEAASLSVTFSETARARLEFLEARGVSQLRGFLSASLALDPLDRARKRVAPGTEPEGPHVLSYRTWRAEFTLAASEVVVQTIFSGYDEGDLRDGAMDPHRDKDVHRTFRAQFPD